MSADQDEQLELQLTAEDLRSVDRALFGSDVEAPEDFAATDDWEAPDDNELAAAATAIAMLGDDIEQPSRELRSALEGQALGFLATDHGLRLETVIDAFGAGSRRRASPGPRLLRSDDDSRDSATAEPERREPSPRGRTPSRDSGSHNGRPWIQGLAAAALLAIGALLGNGLGTSEREAPAADWQRFATRASVTRLDWTGLVSEGNQPSGELLWDSETQQGLMKFRQLEPSAERNFQYQLWIFDEDRAKERPVDGGVFDVGGSGEVVIGIDAKLPVGKAYAFVVTREARGGVVVSDREFLVTGAGDLKRL